MKKLNKYFLNHRTILLVSLLFVLSISACGGGGEGSPSSGPNPTPQGLGYTVSGKLVDAGGAAVPNVTVVLNGGDGPYSSATTDSSGNFSINGVVNGNYTISGSSGYSFSPDPCQVQVSNADVKDITLTLARQDAILSSPESADLSVAGIAIDPSGYIYIVGSTQGNLGDKLGFSGGEDVFVAKYDSMGVRLWVKQLCTPATDFANGVAVDAAGENVFVVGSTEGSDLGGMANLNKGIDDAFVARLNSAGDLKWVRYLGTVDSDTAMAVSVSGGEIFVTGWTNGELGGNGQPLPNGQVDAFISRISPDGTISQIIHFGGNDTLRYRAFSIAAAGQSLYVAGRVNDDDAGTSAGFIAKFPADLMSYVDTLIIPGTDKIPGLAVSGNNIYVAGYTKNHIAFIAKYGDDFSPIWSQQFESTDAMGMAIDSGNNVFITGNTTGSMGGNNQGVKSAFLVKYDGNAVTAKIALSNAQGMCIAAGSNGYVYLGIDANGVVVLSKEIK